MEGLKISWKSPKCAECVTDKNYCIIKIEKKPGFNMQMQAMQHRFTDFAYS